MRATQQTGQPSDSFLVRCWKEPREDADQPAVVRVYVRNLRTGEEHYLNDPARVGELVERGQLEPAGRGLAAEGERRAGAG